SQLIFAAYDLLPQATADDLRRLLRRWSDAAARLSVGEASGSDPVPDPAAAPRDAAAAAGADPMELTLAFGLGAGVFAPERGLTVARPPGLAPLPRFRNDALDPARSGGDLCIQACADDPSVVFHAIRVLGSLAEGVARVRWTQRGFGATTDFRAG